ncbi:MAG: ComF family protein [Planctomycetes bacterium]|nr:ComF family protein [Planctomycetota bacterium]
MGMFADARRLVRLGLDLFFPRRCLGCDDELLLDDHLVCGRCRVALVQDPVRRCAKCASELVQPRKTRGSCPVCRERAFAFRGVVAALRYRGPVRAIVLAIKFGRRAEGVTVLADRLVAELEAHGVLRRIDVVVPIPLHPLRRLTRGFDQAELLAAAVADRIGKPLLRHVLRRRRNTRRQATLRRSERADNLRSGFAPGILSFSVRGRRVLLVDDVLTSGATAHAAAIVLRACKANSVTVAVAARG